MNDDIVLCEIAKRVTPPFSEETQNIIEIEGKSWCVYEGFAECIKDIIAFHKELNSFTKLKCSEENDKLLMVCRKPKNQNARYRKEWFATMEKLFALIFTNYVAQPDVCGGELSQTYITTKFFEALHRKHATLDSGELATLPLNLPARFLPKLCKYQRHTVAWLLKREQQSQQFPAFYTKLLARDKQTIVYKHSYKMELHNNQPEDITLPPGGILAEEMGLGKTVEILALILLHPRNELEEFPQQWKFFLQQQHLAKRRCTKVQLFCICNANTCQGIIQCQKCFLWQHKKCVTNAYKTPTEGEKYFCPACWKIITTESGCLPTKATFIVSPSAIKMQWLEEIKRHIQPALKVLVYEGVTSDKWISPLYLSTYDVVLTDYNILRREIYYTPSNVSDRTTRFKPRSIRPQSPLLMLQWWRVCLDEAQMVESNNSQITAMVHMLPAINRWAVTGTPIQRSLDDLQALLKFIGFHEAAEQATWHYLVNDFIKKHTITDSDEPLELINVLQKCMRRTCKKQIVDELKIPPQREVVHRIEFNNLEKLFYNEQHNECRENFHANIQKYQRRMIAISPKIMKLILQPFLKIRQSCTRPLVVIGNNANNTYGGGGAAPQVRHFHKPQELHKFLKSQNELACKTELRAIASLHNGLASLYFIRQQYDEAIKQYKTVLKLAKDYNELNVSVDSLLQIHALHNIMQILIAQHSKNTTIPNELLEPYEQQCNALEWKYLSTYANTLSGVNAAYRQALDKLNSNVTEEYLPFLSDRLHNLTINDQNVLVQKVFEECSLRLAEMNPKLEEMQSIRSVIYIMQLWFHKVTKLCHDIINEFETLRYFSDNIKSRNQVSPAIWREMMYLVQRVYDCHLSEIREDTDANKSKESAVPKPKSELCKMCKLRDSINNFKCLLFDKVLDEDTNLTKGLDNPSFEMLMHKVIFTFLKTKNKNSQLHTQMDTISQYFDNILILCKRVNKLWIEMEYTVKAYDELNMCKIRLSLSEKEEEKSNIKILQHEIDPLMQQQHNDLLAAQHTFANKLARLKYIRHLGNKDDPGACPICHSSDDDRYAVLQCGHHICYPCYKSIRSYLKGVFFKCSVCRNEQRNENIYFASRSCGKTADYEIIIKGHFTSKITYITRLILKLQQEQQQQQIDQQLEEDSEPLKILIFSQWESILLAIAAALKSNDINYRCQCTPKSIAEFKDITMGITCLLMPLIKGSKGLNLIEATHVFLVEPILNPAEELQAIGRVHRFGQTKDTTVHRFIVNDTIEENIFNFVASKQTSSDTNGLQTNWEFNNVSLEDFNKLFTLNCNNDIN